MFAVISYIAIILLFTALALGLFFGLRIAKII
ncbi:MAG: cytochrome B6 [Hydrococcus sp. Prado102]|nr:cytochrome B6 [Hydrococcus sp. Prado102]